MTNVKPCHFNCTSDEFTKFTVVCQKRSSLCSLWCPRMWAAPGSSRSRPPASTLSLDHSGSSLLHCYVMASSASGGRRLGDMNHVNKLQGGVAALTLRHSSHTVILYTFLPVMLPLLLLLTHRPPVVALATLPQIQTFPLKAEPKPTSVVYC